MLTGVMAFRRAVVTPPTAPSGLTATAIAPNRIDLSWTDNATNETEQIIYRANGPGGAYTEINRVGANVTSYSDMTVPSQTQRCYKVSAVNIAGESAKSNESCATTPPDPPAAPSALNAVAVSSSQIDTSWQDNATNETQFTFQRALDAGFTSGVVTVNPAQNATSYSWTGLSENTKYYFRIRADNTGGSSAWSNTTNATTTQSPPAAPSGLAATVISSSQIDLSWTDNATNEDSQRLQRALDSGFTTGLVETILAANAVSESVTGLAASTTYYFRIRAENTGGNSAWSATASGTTQAAPSPPNAPSNLVATTISENRVDLSWTDNATDEDGFELYRDGALYTTLAPNTTSYSATGLAEGTSYNWKVRAFNNGGNSAFTAEVAGATKLAKPTGLAVCQVVFGLQRISWTDNSIHENNYEVYKDGVLAATLAAGTTTTDLSGIGSTLWKVRAIAAGLPASDFTPEVSSGGVTC